jgi:hypothetical protein
MTRELGIFFLLSTTQCSWCAAPKPTADDEPKDRDAAPAALEGKPRCESVSKIALPGPLEIGRAAPIGSRVVAGARRGDRDGLLEVDGLTARFVETSSATGDLPPPLPIVTGDSKALALAYEGHPRHLVLRDPSSPATPIVELPPEAADESLAYDAVARSDGSIAIAWDAASDEGEAIFATVVRNGKAGAAVRLSPKDVDADTPRLVALGPTILAFWIAHRALPPSDAAPQAEGPGQDLDHAWMEMLAFDDALEPTAPLRHLTPDAGRITFFSVEPRGGASLDLIARDGIELQPGQGGTALVLHISGPDLPAPTVLADHVGRGVPFVAGDFALFDDATDRGRASADGALSPEPTLDAARALAALPDGEVLVAPVAGTELSVLRCRK